MKKLVERAIAGGFGFALILLGLSGVTAFNSIQTLLKSQQHTEQTHKVLQILYDSFDQLRFAEGGRRGYLITHEAQYSRTYEIGVEKTRADLALLRRLTLDHPLQQHLGPLESLIEDRLSVIQRSLQHFASHPDDKTTKIALTNEGMKLQNRIQSLIAQMDQVEIQLLDQQEATTRANAHQVEFIMILGYGLSFTLLGFVYFLWQQQRRSDRTLAQTQLHLEQETANAQLFSLMERISDGLVVLDQDWRYRYVNSKVGQLLEHNSETLIGQNIWQLFPEGINQKFYQAYHEAMDTQQFRRLEEYYPPWGRWFENRIYPSQHGLSIFFQDITTQKQAEIALHHSEQRYRSLVTATSQVVWQTDADGFTTFVQDNGQVFVGQNPADLLGMGWLNSIHPDDRDRVAQVWQTAVETCSLYETEYRLRVAPGVYHDFLARGVPVLEPDGTLREWVGTCTDITEAKQLEARRCQAETALQRAKADLEVKVQARTLELQKLNQELMRSNQELEKFALVVSHDLQEPLRTIRNHVQLLREEQQQEQPNPDLMQESIDFVVEGSVRMQQLIRDLLTYARVGQGTIDFQVNCNIVLDQVLSNLGEAITQSQALISCEPLPILTADKTQLLQLFQNLISNAIKFCQGKQPQIDIGCIGVRTESPDRGDCWIKQAAQTEWLFWVKDNGIGIQAQYLDSVFDIFKRCHPQQAYPGTGMGLAICKKIIEQRGGKIWMESIAGAGTTVYFTIAA